MIEKEFQIKRIMKLWSYWAKALGQKSIDNDREADKVAWIRTFILVTYLVTNCFIVAGVVRHWNGNIHNPNNLHLLEKHSKKI